MARRSFNEWFKTFRESIVTYDYFVDYKKVYRNVDEIKIELNILNSLIGSKTIKSDFCKILREYPKTIKCIPILLAVRLNEIVCHEGQNSISYNFTKTALSGEASVEKYAYFMDKTGLFDLLENHLVSSLVDYVTGVETGLDSNGRKNRGGHLMENLVESYIVKAGFERDIDYFKEMYVSQIEMMWGVDLSNLSNNGKTEKRFDFVVKTDSMVYAIETNFYGSQGSKLNETARSYKTLALESKDIKGFKFVWFTDGKGWNSARNNLEETFDFTENIYNISDLENGIVKRVFV